MASIRAVIRATVSGGTAPASRTCTFPDIAFTVNDELADFGVQAGDLLLVYMADDGGSTSTLTPTEGGWTAHGGPASGSSSMTTALWSRVLDGAPPATFTFTRDVDSQGCTATMVVIAPGEGESLSVTDVDIPNAADGTQHSVQVTGVAGQSVLVTFHANDSALAVTTGPSGMTEGATNDGASHALRTYTQVNPGTGTITKTIEWSATEEMHSAAVLVQASSGGGAITPLLLRYINNW